MRSEGAPSHLAEEVLIHSLCADAVCQVSCVTYTVDYTCLLQVYRKLSEEISRLPLLV